MKNYNIVKSFLTCICYIIFESIFVILAGISFFKIINYITPIDMELYLRVAIPLFAGFISANLNRYFIINMDDDYYDYMKNKENKISKRSIICTFFVTIGLNIVSILGFITAIYRFMCLIVPIELNDFIMMIIPICVSQCLYVVVKYLDIFGFGDKLNEKIEKFKPKS